MEQGCVGPLRLLRGAGVEHSWKNHAHVGVKSYVPTIAFLLDRCSLDQSFGPLYRTEVKGRSHLNLEFNHHKVCADLKHRLGYVR